MGRIYQGQSSLSLRVMTGCVLHGAQDCLIKFRKPDGTEGSFTAELLDEMEGLLSYDVQDGDLDQPGWWRFWAWVIFTDGRSAPGKSVRIYIHREGR